MLKESHELKGSKKKQRHSPFQKELWALAIPCCIVSEPTKVPPQLPVARPISTGQGGPGRTWPSRAETGAAMRAWGLENPWWPPVPASQPSSDLSGPQCPSGQPAAPRHRHWLALLPLGALPLTRGGASARRLCIGHVWAPGPRSWAQ